MLFNYNTSFDLQHDYFIKVTLLSHPDTLIKAFDCSIRVY